MMVLGRCNNCKAKVHGYFQFRATFKFKLRKLPVISDITIISILRLFGFLLSNFSICLRRYNYGVL